MAEGPTQEDTQTNDETMNGSRGMGAAVMSATQDAAGVVRTTAERAAAKLPDAVAGAQVAATETQRVLDEMPSQALLIGTSFSLGLGVGLFVSGANRLLVALALAPAGAMALTMFGREQAASTTTASSARRAASRATGE
jgi:pantoate kinase